MRPHLRWRAVCRLLLWLSGLVLVVFSVTTATTLVVVAVAEAGLVDPAVDLGASLRGELFGVTGSALPAVAAGAELRRQGCRDRRRVVVDQDGLLLPDRNAGVRLTWNEIADVYVTYTGKRDHLLWVDTLEFTAVGGERIFLGIPVDDLGAPAPGRHCLPLKSLDIGEQELLEAVTHFSDGRFPSRRCRIGLL